jgi:hypothetical protein
LLDCGALRWRWAAIAGGDLASFRYVDKSVWTALALSTAAPLLQTGANWLSALISAIPIRWLTSSSAWTGTIAETHVVIDVTMLVLMVHCIS